MRLTARAYVLGALAGTAAAGGLALIPVLPAAFAQSVSDLSAPALIPSPPRGTAIDPDTLVRFKDRDYSVTYEDWVDTTPLERVTVRKIAFGKMTTVTVTSTDSATFSSEALFSPHIRYPGVTVTPVPRAGDGIAVAYWSDGWVATTLLDAQSFIYVAPGPLGDGVLTTDRRTCTFGANYAQC